MNNTKPKTKKSKELPILPICFYGHKRTKLAVLCIERLKQHLKCTGYTPKILFGCCGTDSSYINAVKEAAGDWLYKTFPMRQPDPTINNQLNCAMNDTLKEAFKMSPVVLRLEDDFILEKDLDIGPWCNLLKEDEGVCGVRLGQIQIEPNRVKPYREDLGLDWLDYLPWHRYPINNQVFLVTEKIYDLTGWYREDFSIDEAEFDLGRLYRVRCKNFKEPYPKVLWPHGVPVDLSDSPERYFTHAGASTLGHKHFTDNVPERYKAYQED